MNWLIPHSLTDVLIWVCILVPLYLVGLAHYRENNFNALQFVMKEGKGDLDSLIRFGAFIISCIYLLTKVQEGNCGVDTFGMWLGAWVAERANAKWADTLAMIRSRPQPAAPPPAATGVVINN